MSGRALFLPFIVALLFASCTGGADPVAPDYAILPVSQGPALIQQCSRESPADVSGFWRPSHSEVQAIERRLPEFLRKSGRKIDLSASRRQYIGIRLGRRKLIYVNAFPASELAFLSGDGEWRTIAFTVCAGGEAFWGVEFDPAGNTFHRIGFNEVA